MPVSMLVRTYSPRTSAGIKKLIEEFTPGTPYQGNEDLIFRICDELVKNAIKANYQFLLLWVAARERIRQADPQMSMADANEWLAAIFFAGESVLLERQLAKIPDFAKLQTRVREVLDLENELLKRRKRSDAGSNESVSKEMQAEFAPMLELKRLGRELSIQVQLSLDKNKDQLIIRVENDAPIRERDAERIREVRRHYRSYHDRGEPHMFFVEHMDTSGGGHGLGYALMDSVLLDMGLAPEKCLYLVPGGKTMVLLNLPL